MKAGKQPRSPRAVRASVSFEVDDYAELEAVARQKKVSVAWVVRDAVARYLEERNPLFRSRPQGEEA
jgi:hypothetical protein